MQRSLPRRTRLRLVSAARETSRRGDRVLRPHPSTASKHPPTGTKTYCRGPQILRVRPPPRGSTRTITVPPPMAMEPHRLSDTDRVLRCTRVRGSCFSPGTEKIFLLREIADCSPYNSPGAILEETEYVHALSDSDSCGSHPSDEL